MGGIHQDQQLSLGGGEAWKATWYTTLAIALPQSSTLKVLSPTVCHGVASQSAMAMGQPLSGLPPTVLHGAPTPTPYPSLPTPT